MPRGAGAVSRVRVRAKTPRRGASGEGHRALLEQRDELQRRPVHGPGGGGDHEKVLQLMTGDG